MFVRLTYKQKLFIQLKHIYQLFKITSYLIQEELEDSDNYLQVVTCIEGDTENDITYIFLNSDKTSILCNTTLGTYNSTDLTPCLKTMAYIED